MLAENRGAVLLVDGIVTCYGGIIYHGLSGLRSDTLILRCDDPEIDGRFLGVLGYSTEDIHDDKFLDPCEWNANLLVPTIEKSIVGYMMTGICCDDDEYLMDALNNYSSMFAGDLSKLFAVAAYYDVQDKLAYCIELSKDFDSEF